MVLNLSDFGPSYYENRDLPARGSNNDQDKTGNISRKKHRRMRTDEGDDYQDNIEHVRKKKMKNNFDTKVDSSSSDHSCFVALVTAWNLQKDTLYLPQDLTSSVGLQTSCSEIVVTDERKRSWPFDLRFNKSSETFYITRGWRSFCDVNGKKAGGVFVFKLVGNGETPVLSFCSTESVNDGTQGDKNNKENCVLLERKKKRMRCSNSTLPSQNRFLTLTLTDYNLTKRICYLPSSFAKKSGLDKPGMISLLGKAGMKWLASLQRQASGRMVLGKGWNNFVKANGLRSGKSFTLEAISEKGTRMLCLCSTQSTSDRSQQRECSKAFEKESISAKSSSGNKMRKAKDKREMRRDSLPASMNRFVTITQTHANLIKGRQYLPLSFAIANGLDKPGIITLVAEDGAKWEANLLREKTRMCLGKGWRHFTRANSIKCGESFTLKAILENGTPMLSLCSTQSTSDKSQQGECSKDSEKESISAEIIRGNKNSKATSTIEERRDSSLAIKNRSVTLTLTPEDVRDCKLILPRQFMKASGISKLGKITLLGQQRMKWFAYLLSRGGIVAVGSGWKGFCEANGVKTGDSFTLECIDGQNTTPVFKFCSNSDP